MCEFYNCSTTSDEPCYHGYVACAEDPLAVSSYPNHTHHYCEATYREDEELGLYRLYHKGCRFTSPQLATQCTPGDCHVAVIDGDTDIACCCDGQLCNVNVTFSDPSRFYGFGKYCNYMQAYTSVYELDVTLWCIGSASIPLA